MASFDFTLNNGDTKDLEITVTSDGTTAVDITGSTIKWVLVNGTTAALPAKSVGSGITITNATAGQFTIAITSTDTQNLSPGTYSHAARLIDSSNNSEILFTGTITIVKSYV